MSSSKVKKIGQSSQLREENVAKVVRATLTGGFLVNIKFNVVYRIGLI